MTTGACTKCGKHGYILPLHGSKGGPLMCFLCSGAWQAEHGRRNRAGNVLIKAMRAYDEAGGQLYKDLDEMRLVATGIALPGYESEAGKVVEVVDISAELLADTLKLTHPDRHPPERSELAKRVTQELLALKPFVFPAPKPKPAPPPRPNGDASSNSRREEMGKPSSPPYPCRDCRDAHPRDYCDVCKAEYEKKQQRKREEEEKKRQERNERQRKRYAQMRHYARKKTASCMTCGIEFEPKRRDAKYCSAACRQRAYVKRDGSGSNERPLDSAFIEQAIEAAFAADPDSALSTVELCCRIIPDVPRVKRWSRGWIEVGHPDKKHRLAVIAAARRVIKRQLAADPGKAWDWFRGETRGSGLVFFNTASIHSFVLGRLKSDWVHADDSDEKLSANLQKHMAEGSDWRRHWEMYVAERKGETETPRYTALRKEQDRINASWGL